MEKDTQHTNSVASGCISFEDAFAIEAYAHHGTFRGIADYIKAVLHKDWPLGSLPQLLNEMLTWLDKKTPEIIGKTDDKQHEREGIVNGFRESLVSGIDILKWIESNDVNQTAMMMYLFEIGYYCGVVAATLGEDHSWLQESLHKQKSGQGGKTKAKKEKDAKLKILEPLFKKLKEVRFAGQYRDCRSAVAGLLDQDDLGHIYDHIPPEGNKYPIISYDDFLYSEAKKIWDATLRPTDHKKHKQ